VQRPFQRRAPIGCHGVPTGACANTAEPTKAHSQGVKDHRATPNLHGDPDNRRTGRRQPRPHRLTASRSLTALQQLHDAGAGLGAQTKPAHTALAATAAGARELHSDEPPRR